MILPTISQFRDTIWSFYRENKRILPWRDIDDPYGVLVSEIMLQQTQVPRVLIKYGEFMAKFPTFQALHEASMKDVLVAWQGMGYNRRAKYLKMIADIVIEKYEGILPRDPEILLTFPGIGRGTAGSLPAFAYNIPTVFIETNIRRVFIHVFFADRTDVHDREIMPLIEDALDQKEPRQWYYALMDYGTMLGKLKENPNVRSRHYTKQSKFEGSDRQIRGRILKALVARQSLDHSVLVSELSVEEGDNDRVDYILSQMVKEGMIRQSNHIYTLPE